MRICTLALLFSFMGVSGCNNSDITRPSEIPRGTEPPKSTTTVPVTQTSRIEFRVAGNATSARVRFTNAQDGTTILTTTLPYVTTVTTTESSMFVSLEATPISYPFSSATPFLSVQIFVNGSLFREAIAEDYSYSTLSVSGTWRR